MGFFDRLSRLFRANLNDLLNKAEDPAKILDQSVIDMQADLERLRDAVANAIASQKRLARQAEQANAQAENWYQRAEQAMEKGEEELAREALIRRKTFQQTFSSLSNQLDGQEGQVEMLKRSLMNLEGKIAEARTKKDMLKARAQAAQAQQQLENAVGSIGTNSAIDAFERMEDKVESLEASSEAAAELAGVDLESKFDSLANSNEIDDELDKLRRGLQSFAEPAALPLADNSIINKDDSSLDIELVDVSEVETESEEIKKSIEDN